MNGTIKRLNPEKGYGFIGADALQEDIYFKIPSGDGFVIDADVSFDTAPAIKNPKERMAVSVRLGHTAEAVNVRQTSPYPKGRPQSAAQPPTYSSYYMPSDTANLLFKSSGVPIDNVALKLQKYLPVPETGAAKRIVRPDRPVQDFTKTVKDMLKAVTDAQLGVSRAYEHKHAVTAKLGGRMIVGLGGANVHETSITFHHTYGCPYIPGSGVKGCLRSFAVRDLFGGKEADAMKDAGFVKVFGSQENSGKMIFLDAFPRTFERLDIDIMNPHYPEYYKGPTARSTTAPTDDGSPVPLKFYAVLAGTEFVFRLVSKAFDPKALTIQGVKLTELLADTLAEIGIGAKTAVGYGWFSNVEVVNG